MQNIRDQNEILGNKQSNSEIICYQQYDLDDCEQAINYTVVTYPNLNPKKISIVGFGYGASVALELAVNQKGGMPTILINPISDIGAMSSSVDLREWSYHVMGVNYSMASVPNEILTKAWEK